MNANEPAYPCRYETCVSPVGNMQHIIQSGLTKRELIAAMALQGLLSALSSDTRSIVMAEIATRCEISSEEAHAVLSVKAADALLAELERTQPK